MCALHSPRQLLVSSVPHVAEAQLVSSLCNVYMDISLSLSRTADGYQHTRCSYSFSGCRGSIPALPLSRINKLQYNLSYSCAPCPAVETEATSYP